MPVRKLQGGRQYRKYARQPPQIMSNLAQEFAIFGTTIGVVGASAGGALALGASQPVISAILPVALVTGMGLGVVTSQ